MHIHKHAKERSVVSLRSPQPATSTRKRRKKRWRFRTDAVVEVMRELFGEDLHAKRVRALGSAVSGLLEAAALSVTAIGAALAAKDGLHRKHSVKQVDRLVSNPGLDDTHLQALWTQYALGAREEAVIAMVLDVDLWPSVILV